MGLYLGIFAAVVIVVIIGMYLWVHSADIKINVKDPTYTKEMLYKERDELMQRYHDVHTKVKELTGDYFDLAFEEYKALERELEINRMRIKYLDGSADTSCGKVVKK